MRESMLPPLYAVLAFLMPLGIYCLFLTSVNRRPRPVFVHGVMDALGLLFAGSGLFLVTVPILINEFYRRSVAAQVNRSPVDVWLDFWLMWLIYYLFVLSGAASMLLWRARKTMIYNVDPELLLNQLEPSASQLGMHVLKQGQRVVLLPAESTDPTTATRYGELIADSFPWLCHVTLHWRRATGDLRSAFESRLSRNAESATAHDNPASGWFLSVAGMIFGAVAMIVLTLTVVLFMSLRW